MRTFTPGRALALAMLAVLAACSEAPQQRPAPPPPKVTVSPSGQAQRHRSGRVCRPLRGRRQRRNSRPGIRLSRPHPFHRRPDRQAGRPAVHHRQAAVPDHARSGQGQSPAGASQSRLYRGRSRPRRAAREGAHHHRADLRPAHPGQARRRGLGGGADGRGQAGVPRPRIHRAEGAGRRPDRRPPGVAGQSGHRQHDRHHLAARNHRLDRSDPLRIHLRRGVVPALRAARQGRARHDEPRRQLAGRRSSCSTSRTSCTRAGWTSSTT